MGTVVFIPLRMLKNGKLNLASYCLDFDHFTAAMAKKNLLTKNIKTNNGLCILSDL